jgi:hypothetical protein
VPRRRRPLSVTRLAVSAQVLALFAALALVPVPGMAQTPVPDPGADLLQPSLQSNPNNPPRFNPPENSAAPPAGKFTAPTRIGVTPVYGSPTGFGAGDTGFDSSNRPHRSRTAKTPATGSAIAPASQMTFDNVPAPPLQLPSTIPVLASPPPAVVYPAKAASRPGAVLPPPPDPLPLSNPPVEVHPAAAASRPGAVLPIPPALDFSASSSTPPPGTPQPNTLPLGTPSRPLPIVGADPYEALGIKAGSFLILPSLELSGGYDNNPQHTPGGPGSATAVVAPELHVRSDWSRHAFTADITGSYYWYGNDSFTPSLNRPYLNSKLDGRIDVTRDTHILLENRFIVSTDNPGSPNIQAGLAKLPIDMTVGGTVGLDQQLSRFDVTLKGTLDRSVYQNSELTNGETANNDWRAFDQYAGILRVGYEIDPGVKPFVEVSADTRIHDSPVDIYGQDRNSTGTSAKVGGAFNLFGSLTGEMAVGYMERDYIAPLPKIGGATLDGSLIWQATALTTAKFTAASAVNESILQGVSGSLSRDFNIEVDHAFRTWLIAAAKVGYGRDDYVGLARDDNRYFVSIGLIYKLNREMQLKGELRHDWLASTAVGVNYEATSFLAGLRLQR